MRVATNPCFQIAAGPGRFGSGVCAINGAAINVPVWGPSKPPLPCYRTSFTFFLIVLLLSNEM